MNDHEDTALAEKIEAFKEANDAEKQRQMRPDRYKAMQSGAAKRRKIECRRAVTLDATDTSHRGHRWHIFDGTMQLATFINAKG